MFEEIFEIFWENHIMIRSNFIETNTEGFNNKFSAKY